VLIKNHAILCVCVN